MLLLKFKGYIDCMGHCYPKASNNEEHFYAKMNSLCKKIIDIRREILQHEESSLHHIEGVTGKQDEVLSLRLAIYDYQDMMENLCEEQIIENSISFRDTSILPAGSILADNKYKISKDGFNRRFFKEFSKQLKVPSNTLPWVLTVGYRCYINKRIELAGETWDREKFNVVNSSLLYGENEILGLGDAYLSDPPEQEVEWELKIPSSSF